MVSFKIANKDWEFQEIHKLNYETFVEEIPQHESNSTGLLVDKFHNENTYIVCLNEHGLAGMIAVRDKRPFSLDNKLKDLDDHLPGSRSLCELRLLAIRKKYRKKKVIKGLFKYLARYCENNYYDLAVISASIKELSLYKRLGFTKFGPLVGKNGASFQPMYLTCDSYGKFKNSSRILSDKEIPQKYFYQPGPVNVKTEVKEEFAKPPVSHRSEKFEKELEKVQKKLSQLVNCKSTQTLMGSGTLANDVVAAHLSTLEGKGLILSNGEFGDRLIDHAERSDLDFATYSVAWGDPLQNEKISDLLKNGFEWLWFVHCETSTGVLNNLKGITDICADNSVKSLVDCISSLGTVPVDLKKAYMATGVSGKGLASYPGLSFVFYNHLILPKRKNLPRYLDLNSYVTAKGVPYTLSSNLLYAVSKALELTDVEANSERSQECSVIIRNKLKDMGLEVVGKNTDCSPAIVTFKIPEGIDPLKLGKKLENQGIYISYRSRYLTERNLMQFALMGEYSKHGVEFALSRLTFLTAK